MKRHLLLVSFCLMFTGFSAYSQSSTNTHVAPTAVTKSTVLSEISQKIASKEASIVAGSRSTAAQLSSELKALYGEYSTALTAQIKSASGKELEELNQELRYSEKRKAELTK